MFQVGEECEVMIQVDDYSEDEDFQLLPGRKCSQFLVHKVVTFSGPEIFKSKSTTQGSTPIAATLENDYFYFFTP